MNLSECPKHEQNPFAEGALTKIGENLVAKKVFTSNKDERAILQAVDNNGEVIGNTVFARNKMVDEEQYVKFFFSGFSAFFDLKASSLKVFQYIITLLKPDRDSFILFVSKAVEFTKLSPATIYRALAELCTANIIARGRFEEEFFINPICIFNGNRVTFATSYINANYTDYQTSAKNLKLTIENMQNKGLLPAPKKDKKQLEIPWNDNPDTSDIPEDPLTKSPDFPE